MKQEMRKVSVKKDGKLQEVSQIEVSIYETAQELIDNVDESVILAKFNKMNVIDLQASERAKHQPGRVGKSVKMKLAFNYCTQEEILACDGDYDKFQTLLESKLPKVEAEMSESAD
jgi:hypothetical protein